MVIGDRQIKLECNVGDMASDDRQTKCNAQQPEKKRPGESSTEKLLLMEIQVMSRRRAASDEIILVIPPRRCWFYLSSMFYECENRESSTKLNFVYFY